jgi:hypothetical protein
MTLSFEKLKEREHLEDLGVKWEDDKKWYLKKQNEGVFDGSNVSK